MPLLFVRFLDYSSQRKNQQSSVNKAQFLFKSFPFYFEEKAKILTLKCTPTSTHQIKICMVYLLPCQNAEAKMVGDGFY